MAESIKVRSVRSFQSVESVIDAIRDNVHRVEELTSVLARQRDRTYMVSYLLGLAAGLVALVVLMASALQSGAGYNVNTRLIEVGSAALFAISMVGFILVFMRALNRKRMLEMQLIHASTRLKEILKVASQAQEHLELDRLQDMTLQFHLREAESALDFANEAIPMPPSLNKRF